MYCNIWQISQDVFLLHMKYFARMHQRASVRVCVRVPARTRWVICELCDTPTVCKQNRKCFGPLGGSSETGID